MYEQSHSLPFPSFEFESKGDVSVKILNQSLLKNTFYNKCYMLTVALPAFEDVLSFHHLPLYEGKFGTLTFGCCLV